MTIVGDAGILQLGLLVFLLLNLAKFNSETRIVVAEGHQFLVFRGVQDA